MKIADVNNLNKDNVEIVNVFAIPVTAVHSVVIEDKQIEKDQNVTEVEQKEKAGVNSELEVLNRFKNTEKVLSFPEAKKGNHSVDKKVKLVKELKSLGSGNILPHNRKLEGGAKKVEAALYLKEIIKDNEVLFVGLLEMKISSMENNQLLKLLGINWDIFQVRAVGLSGGLMVLCRKDLASFTIIESSSQMILGLLNVTGRGSWKIASVYGSTSRLEIRKLWIDLEKHCTGNPPMVVGGDFNCVMSQAKKRGGKRFILSQGSKDFNNFMIQNDLHEVKAMGPKLTWCNNKTGNARILEKLDRCLINSCALDIIHVAVVKYLSWVASDHCPILLEIFKPLEFNRVIRLNTWWRQRAKAKWMDEGDCNSSFFHAFANARRCSNWISHIKAIDGTISEEEEVIQKMFSDFFRLKWQHRSYSLEGWPTPVNTIGMMDQKMLDAKFSRKELQVVVNDSKRNVSLGNDGISFAFIKDFWHIIKDDVWLAISQFLLSGVMDQTWKETLIVLIPKTKCPQEPINYRPISLCMTVYKLIAKMLLNRLERVIQKIISVDQAAFIKGHSLSDHVLLAHEVFNKFRWSKARSGMFPIKLDMEQAYDSMGWQTLRQVLIQFNFPTRFMELILQCVLNPKFCILINGKKTDWIDGKCGFRQGCPLSPFLFIPCSQILSNALVYRRYGLGISISSLAPRVSHLLFAYDFLIFSEAKMEDVKELKSIISNYCNWTGQRVNTLKSMIIFGKHTKRNIQKKITKKLNFKVVKEMGYLGVKLALRRLVASDFQNLLEVASNRLNTWGKKFISLEGKLVLLSFFISNGTWNLDRLEDCFGEQLMEIISNILINISRNSDQLELNCKFSGKSVTALAFEATLDHGNCLDFLQRVKGMNFLGANLFCTTVYLVWKSRCKLIHGDREDSDNSIAVNAISFDVSSNFLYIQPGFWDANQLGLLSTWHPLPPGWIKINVDAALKRNNMAGIGGVARDDQGRFLVAFGENCWHWDISQLELLAVVYLKKVVKDWMFKAQGVIIEGDNLNIIKMLQSAVKSWKVSRNGNKLADICANLALDSSFLWENIQDVSIPSSLGDDFEREERAPEPTPAREPNFQDLVHRFDHLETHFYHHFDQIENHLQQQDVQHQQDMGWMRGQLDAVSSNMAMMSSFFNFFNQPPPPDQSPSE
ncbi:hypothetical protein KFK09_022783 [Dendrobium nobile]|uniref:Reverse transcriptase domain-containing protein n=1 Tax=Dendrobium nobile TaxID=94219 RepID=A0A8T3AIR8_DENNO|nr:hypothetical protein KFK09_022783 [Dendrobium nobile]